MNNSAFAFKQFTVSQDRCAMKVGTDGVLLGAWAPVNDVKQILDVGTGTGLIALQLAQRNPLAHITAIEIDAAAASQAQENITLSPWADRMEVICRDFRQYESPLRFDLIVSNPPYFTDALKCPDVQRNTARHTDELNYDQLFRRSSRLLGEAGKISIIIPTEAEKAVMDASWLHGFAIMHRCQVFTKPDKPCRRLLLTFHHPASSACLFTPCQEETLCIQTTTGEYTPEYIALTHDFYLKM